MKSFPLAFALAGALATGMTTVPSSRSNDGFLMIHKGQEMCISFNAADKHLAHGDSYVFTDDVFHEPLLCGFAQ